MTDRISPERVIANFLDWWLADELKGTAASKRRTIDGIASLIGTELFVNSYIIIDKETDKPHTGHTGLRHPILGDPDPELRKPRKAKTVKHPAQA